MTFLSFVSISCKKRETAVEIANQNKQLLVGIGFDPQTLDPHLATEKSERTVLQSLFEGLVSLDSKTLEVLPGVASHWTISDDRRIYKFFIRREASWQNGEKITSHDFVSSFKRCLSSNLCSPKAYLLYGIKNAEKFHKNIISNFKKVGIRAIDSNCLEIELEHPIAYFLSILSQPIAFPVYHKHLESIVNIDHINNSFAFSEKYYTSNGPFKLKNWFSGDKIIVEKNEFYWNRQNIFLNSIKFHAIEDPNTEERAFRSGQLHITENVPYQKLKFYLKTQELRLNPISGVFYYVFNTKKKPLNDKRVRLALSLAIDRNSLAGNDQLFLKHIPCETLIPPIFFETIDCKNNLGDIKSLENSNKTRLEIARKLLAESGFPNGKNFPKLKLIFNNSEGQNYLAEAIQEIWKKSLNIKIELVSLEFKSFLQKRGSQSFDLARGGWIAEFNSPETFLFQWTEKSVNNFSNWHSENFELLLSELIKTQDKSKRDNLLLKLSNLLNEEMPGLPIHSNQSSHLVHKSVSNWTSNRLDSINYSILKIND